VTNALAHEFGSVNDNVLRTTLKRSGLWLFFSSGILAVVTVAFWTFLEVRSFAPQPAFEDAAMLFRYATNLADGHGITWNVGQAPGSTDGATDLGFVLALAPLVLSGVPVTVAAFALNWLAVFLLGGLLGRACRGLFRIPEVAIFLLVILLFSGPVNRYIQSGFSPAIFGLLLTITAVAALWLYRKPTSNRWRWFFMGMLVGSAGWWRPEGFALSALIFLAITAIAISQRDVYPNVKLIGFASTFLGYVVAFAAWVVFRLLYFTHLMPSSTVLKSGGVTPGNAVEAIQFLTLCLMPLLAVAFFVSLVTVTRIWISCLLLLAMSIIWIPVTMHLNWWDRMQWPIVPALSLVVIASISATRPSLPKAVKALRLSATGGIFIGLIVIAVLRTYGLSGIPYSQYEPHTPLGDALSKVDTSGLRIATSEAGLIPLAVTGQALDTYGYNNYAIARSDGSQVVDELKKLNPNMIVLAGPIPTSGISPESSARCAGTDLSVYLGTRWMNMAASVVKYADEHQFQLARAFDIGSCVIFSVYVNAETPSSVRESVSSFKTSANELTLTLPN
jgi:hypothetical protein